MSASERAPNAWLDERFWARFDGLETRHQHAQSAHEHVRRDLESTRRESSAELAEVWSRYCAVIAELERSTAELETLRSQGIG